MTNFKDLVINSDEKLCYLKGNSDNRLIELGCVPQKSLILRFPSLTIFSSVNLIRHFVRGYVDGDGSLSYTTTGRLVIYIIGTKEFLSKIISLFSII